MSKYMIEQPDLNGKVWIRDIENEKAFNGYDFMGSVNWEDLGGDAYWMDPEEAKQILADLEAADAPTEDPAKKQYLFKVWIEGEQCVSIKTGKQIADYYEQDQIAGICSEMQVWDVSGDPKRISLLGLVSPILENKRWMEQEYRDYCENEEC